jgi:hypothetical protein
MTILPNIGHGRPAEASTIAAVNWMTDRFVGEAPQTTVLHSYQTTASIDQKLTPPVAGAGWRHLVSAI